MKQQKSRQKTLNVKPPAPAPNLSLTFIHFPFHPFPSPPFPNPMCKRPENARNGKMEMKKDGGKEEEKRKRNGTKGGREEEREWGEGREGKGMNGLVPGPNYLLRFPYQVVRYSR